MEGYFSPARARSVKHMIAIEVRTGVKWSACEMVRLLDGPCHKRKTILRAGQWLGTRRQKYFLLIEHEVGKLWLDGL